MRPPAHIAASLAGGIALATAFNSWLSGIAFFVSGVFIDIDHHIDYLLHYKKWPWSYKNLVDFCSNHKLGRLFLVFHSYELFLLAWLLITILPANVVLYSFVLGATVHIIMDQIFNPLRPYGYFFFYRQSHGFSKDCIFVEK